MFWWSILHSTRTQHLFTGDGFGIVREVEIEHDPVVKDVDRVDKGINDLPLVLHVSHVTLAEFLKPEPHPFAGPEAVAAVVDKFSNTTGIRDLEQAAEHIAANTLYQIEVDKVESVTVTKEMVDGLF